MIIEENGRLEDPPATQSADSPARTNAGLYNPVDADLAAKRRKSAAELAAISSPVMQGDKADAGIYRPPPL